MRIAAGLVVFAIGCGTPPLEPRLRPATVDPSLGEAPAEALAEWQLATGGRYPDRVVSFGVKDMTGRLGNTSPSGADEMPWFVNVVPGLDGRTLRLVLLHELGHVAGLLVDPDSGDPAHWHGAAPSVMRPALNDCADEIGLPELAAFDRKYGR